MKMKHPFVLLLVLSMMITLFAGCGSSAPSEQKEATETAKETTDAVAQGDTTTTGSTEEVTVKILYPWGQGFFDNLFKDIDEKLPNIKIELVDAQAKLEPLQELNAKQIVPDIIFANWGIEPLEELGMIEPLDDLMAKHNFDESAIDPSILAYWRAVNPEGKLTGMPSSSDNYTMYYNKEVFDLFGVPYPSENMTWEEMVDLAKQLTGERDGIQYRGLEMGPGFSGYEALVPLLELNTNLTDPKTGEVLIDKKPEMTKYLELMKKFYSIPGIYDRDPEARKDYAFGKKNVAMIVSWPGYIKWGIGDPEVAKNMDSVPVPVWADLPNIAPPSGSHPYVINKYSEHKDAAFQVLAEYVSAEKQTKLAKAGDPPVLTDPKVYAEFGADLDIYKGKNIQAFFSREAAVPKTVSKWDQYVDIPGSLSKFAESDMNIQEFLRVLKEESETKIKEAMAKAH
ncbi:ABC transporter substrate-binding protein [Paenibacillus guangzhouensis]|uniref:ABC transporter substrate-binding protein n=1 Tax=Paenibacillus guangzhouensis TaxID=1473112 RepID=UPI0012671C91|nr:extracellular solute-binding protein [Paenibacillus guangzhouensis]